MLEEAPSFLGPPNLQVNASLGYLSKRWMGTQLGLAALAAAALQLGLIAIAVVTVYHEPTRVAIGPEPKIYGFPCYVGGTIALFIAMIICSLAVERSTTEYLWEREKKPTNAELKSIQAWQSSVTAEGVGADKPIDEHQYYPRLFWLQKSQTVSDQSFGSYVILGGHKRLVLTSSRQEDVKDSRQDSTPNGGRGSGNSGQQVGLRHISST